VNRVGNSQISRVSGNLGINKELKEKQGPPGEFNKMKCF
jgi:hypothetical protein